MATAAYSALGTAVRVSDGNPGILTVTNATNTTPITITTSAVHGIVDVGWVTVAGVGGNGGANGAWVAQFVSTTSLILRGSVGTGAYTSGGTATVPGSFASIAELRNVTDAGSRTDLIDVSSHDSGGYSSEIGSLKRMNQMQLDVNLVPNHPTHNPTTGLLYLYNSGVGRDWLLVLPPYPATGVKATAHFFGKVIYYTINLPVTAALQAQITLAGDGKFTWTP